MKRRSNLPGEAPAASRQGEGNRSRKDIDSMVKRTPLLRQPALYIGLALGIIIAVLIGLLATVFLSPQSAVYKPATALPSAGNIVISVEVNLVVPVFAQ